MRLCKAVTVVIGALFIALIGCGKDNPASVDDQNTYITHTSKKGDYTVQYPRSWIFWYDSVYTYHNIPTEQLKAFSDTTNAAWNTGVPLFISISSTNWTGMSGTTLTDSAYVVTVIKPSFNLIRDSTWTIISEGAASVDGKPGYKWVYEYPDSTYGTQRITDIYVWRNPIQDIISFQSTAAKHDVAQIDSIIGSIQYK